MSSITIDKPWGNGADWTIRQRGPEKKPTHFVNYLQAIVFDRREP